jgi:metal-responsive CopG/Arc/MetJ family transcriptional regulator
LSPKKVRAGVSFDPRLVETLDGHVKKLSGLQVDRSEVVNAVLEEYFEGNGSTESVWETVAKRRTRSRAQPADAVRRGGPD